MAFIRATWLQTKSPITINVDHIVAIYPHGDNTIIQTSSPNNGGSLQYWTAEPFKDIEGRIQTSQAYGTR